MGEVRSPALVLRTTLGLLLALSAVRDARADYRVSYSTGIKAMDLSDWQVAVQAFQAAIQERPAEGGSQVWIYGQRYRPYLPHYYLGVAYLSLGNCEAALKEWKESESQGAVRQSKEHANLVRFRTQCEARVASTRPKPATAATAPPAVALAFPTPTARSAPPIATTVPKLAQRLEPTSPARIPTRGPIAVPPVEIARLRREAEAEIGRARGAANALAILRAQTATNPIWQADVGFRRREDGARRTLEAAQAALRDAKARNDITGFSKAQRMAADATAQFNTVQKSLRDRAEQARIQREKEDLKVAGKELEARRTQALELLRELKTPTSSQMRQARSDLEASLERGKSGSSDRSVEELRKLSDDLAGSIASPRRLAVAPAPPPPELVQGAAAFFRGDYARATQLLASKPLSDPRAAAQAHLFLAASRYGSYLLEGAENSRLREQASRDVRDCVRLNPAIAVNVRAFSPRFLEFFRKEGGEVAARPAPD